MFNGCGASVLQGKRVLDMDGGDGCTEMCMCLMPLNWPLESSKFYVIIFKNFPKTP